MNVLVGIDNLLVAFALVLMVYAFYRVGQLGRMECGTRKAVIGLLEMLNKGVPATLTMKDGKGIITLGCDEDEDDGKDGDPGEGGGDANVAAGKTE